MKKNMFEKKDINIIYKYIYDLIKNYVIGYLIRKYIIKFLN